MHKTELIALMAERFPQLLFKDSENAVNLIIDELIVALATGDRVSFVGFGSFETRDVQKRTRTNPRNGDPVEVPAKRVVKFNSGKELRERCGLSEYLRERNGSWRNQENVGVDVLEKYSNHPDRQVIGAILENENCTPELVAKIAGLMASSPDPVDRLTVASSGKSCPPELIKQFCSDKDEGVRAKAAEHCPVEMFDVLARDKSVKVRAVLASRSDLTDAVTELLIGDKSEKVRLELAVRTDLTETAAVRLAHDKSSDIRRMLAKYSRKRSILSILTRDPEIEVRRLVLEPDEGRSIDYGMEYPECPAEILALMADDESEAIRIAVAEKDSCMAGTFEKLAADTEVEVRLALAENGQCPESVLVRLASDPDKRVRERVARFGSYGSFAPLNAALMRDLARDVEPAVRRTIGRRKDCPVDLLQTLAIDSNLDVRCGVAANEACPADLLRIFANEPDPWIRKLVGGNNACPPDLLAMLATDESDDVRAEVADNKNCPDALLERLRHDKAPSVFGAALRAIHSR
jgi:integration host factor subunit beta